MTRLDQVYVLMYKGTPVAAHSRWEGASEMLARYSAEQQREANIYSVRVYD